MRASLELASRWLRFETKIEIDTSNSKDSVLKTDQVFQNTSKFHCELMVRGSLVALGGSVLLVVCLINNKAIESVISAAFAVGGLAMVGYGYWDSRNVQEI